MAKSLLTAAPPWSRRLWMDATSLYLEIPVVGSTPLIVRYAKTEGALTKALAIINTAFRESLPKAGHATFNLDHPKIVRKTRGKTQAKYSEAERDAMASLLRKAGITK